MLGAIAIDRWAGTWRGMGGAVLALLLVVVGAKASASPPGFVGPVDVERWKPGPVYVLELKGGGKYGLFPEVFDDYLAAAENLHESDVVVVVIEDEPIAPWHMPAALAFVEELGNRARVVAYARNPRNGTAMLTLAFPDRYIAPGGAIHRQRGGYGRQVWTLPTFLSAGWKRDADYSGVAREAAELGGGPLAVLNSVIDARRPLSYDVTPGGAFVWRDDEEGESIVSKRQSPLEISSALAVESGLVIGAEENVRELALELTANPNVRLVKLGWKVPIRWQGCFAQADELVDDLWGEFSDALKEAEATRGPVAGDVVEKLEATLAPLAFWERALGAIGPAYGLAEGTTAYYRWWIEVVRVRGKTVSWMTQTELDALAEDMPYMPEWPERE